MISHIYTALRAHIKTELTDIKWIDIDKGQLELFGDRPPVSFPCVLMEFQIPSTRDYNHKKTLQQCQVVITLKIGFSFTGDTHSAKSDAALDDGLAYLHLCEAVHEKIQGYQDEVFTAITRQRMTEQQLPNNHKMMTITYTTSYSDL